MAYRLQTEDRWPLLLAPLIPILLGALAVGGASAELLLAVALAGALVIAGLYLTAFVDIAWLFSGAVAMTLFSGHWRDLGFPGLLSPDRLLLVVAFVVFLLRDPSLGRRAYFRLTPTHVVLVLAAAFAICSAVAAGTIAETSTLFPLLDRFGLVPFLLFAAGPVAFASEHQRRILLGTFLAIGAYLGLTSLFTGLGLDSLVFPRYIVELGPEVQAGRARGPFGDSAINGVALFYCAVAAAVAYVTIPKTWVRNLALAIGALCVFDLIFTQQRSVWIGALAAALCAAAAAPPLRRRLPLALGLAAVALLAAFVLVPGLHQQTTERIGNQRTEWDRLNLNKAATNMIAERPLLGFGLGTFKEKSGPYFEQDQDFPLTNTTGELHNVFLSNATQLGLLGASIWLLGLVLAVGGAIAMRGPPQLYPWRIGLLAIAVMWLVVANLVPMVQAFPNQVLWLWAGVVWPWRYTRIGSESNEGDDGRAVNG
ncbi:MAG TPA: O-antigen ligase family protein [Solirubrobacterales bacterium]|nr:O-antigen ligase family protein [Solirubrobacterales bacterium]